MTKKENQKNFFRDRLMSLSPPDIVINTFDKLCLVRDDFSLEDNLEDILRDACRLENWTVPWQTEGMKLSFRAKKLDRSHPEFKEDVGGTNSPAEEQCYRRGYSHGFNRAKQAVSKFSDPLRVLAPIEKDIEQWRFAEIYARNSMIWGQIFEPNYPCTIRTTSRRSGMSLKTRYAVLERDGRRCVICGAAASDGVVLEVDHIKPVSKGGTDILENLQTLCFDCNRGKADFE